MRPPAVRDQDRGETAILLHGLGSGPAQLALLAKRLRRVMLAPPNRGSELVDGNVLRL